MVLAGPFLLPRGAGVKGAKKLFRRLRRRGAEDGECPSRAAAAAMLLWVLPSLLRR